MTETEFLSRLPEGTRKPSKKEFELIQFVYSHHPSIHTVDYINGEKIEGKDQIAMLYNTFGMRIICDMQETAKRAQELEDERSQLKARLIEVEREREALFMM